MKRTVLGVIVPFAWFVAAVVPFSIAWSHLPEPLATHWSLLGHPNGAMPRVTALALHAGFALLAAIGAFVVTRPGDHPRGIATGVGVATFVGSLFAAIAVAVVIANYGAASWRDAHQNTLALLLAPAFACVATAIASRAARSLEPAAAPLAPLSTVGLGATERATWVGSARNRGFAIGGIAALAVAAAAYVLGNTPTAITLAIAGIVMVPFGELHARVDDRGLAVGFGPVAWPRIRVALADIRSARQLDIDPTKHGGWGYRGSLTVFGKAAAIVRRGDGLELQLDHNRTLIVSTDDAATAAGLLNDLVRRR
ncbi:MAG TPA: DUF1648 domain-containing protein [Kofleriaceae bacterium]|jgi:hypothetical protein